MERLNAGMDRKLTLVSAPAGYGKTTLLSAWIQQGNGGVTPTLPVAWLSLDEADNDPVRFLTYVIGAAQTIVPRVGEDLLSMLQSPEPPPADAVLTLLINELTASPQDCDRCCLLGLVLDDYHLIENTAVHDAVAFLVDRLPPPRDGIHLIITTRKDPLLPLPRWRAGAQMTELREADLRFTHEEATAFLTQAMGLTLSEEQVGILEARTEGWISGLQLAALSMRGLDAGGTARFISAFTGADRHIVDYLVDEVLDQRPGGTQDFLLKTSILERVSGSLGDAVRRGEKGSPGSEGGQQILETLERANLFVVPLDNQRQWYRYHHLFADLLRHRLRQAVDSAGLAALHLRASKWYEQNGLVADAVHHALAAKDFYRAARLVEGNARELFARSELATITNWVDALPEDVVQTRPWLCIYYAWALRLTGGQAEAVESRLRAAERALEQPNAAQSEDEMQDALGHIAALRAYQALYREEFPKVIGLARQALRSLPEVSFVRGLTALALGWASRFSGDLVGASQAFMKARAASLAAGTPYVAVTATCRLAYTQVLGGQLRQAAKNCQEAVQMATGAEGRHLPVAGYALVYLGGVYREWNNPEAAARHLVEGIDLCAQVGYILDQVVGYATLARVRQAQQDWDGAHEALQSAERLSLKMKGYVYARRWVEDCQIRLWSAEGRLAEVARWIRETELRVDHEVGFARELEHIILARALVAVGRDQRGKPTLEDALDLLARLLETAETAGWMGKAVEILALQALAHQAQGEVDEALSALERALSTAEPEGYVRTFVDEGPPMARLLSEAAERGIAPDYARRLLDAFGDGKDDADASIADVSIADVSIRGRTTKAGAPSALVEPLTEREVEVLQLIAEGLSNREIAARLFLALSTVKVHTRNIYGKLDVHNRTQAVTRARDLGLL
jgi:LuxR family maltose regulon positive regulatory protein